jgi:hypothetical protein
MRLEIINPIEDFASEVDKLDDGGNGTSNFEARGGHSLIGICEVQDHEV